MGHDTAVGLPGGPVPETRQCGRCREHFPVGPADERPTWWACGPCRLALFGAA